MYMQRAFLFGQNMDQAMMDAKPPMEDEEAHEAPEGSGDYVVEIACHPDGTYTVSGPESHRAEGMEGGESGGQTTKSVDEALKIARSMIDMHKGDEGMSVEKAFGDVFNEG